MLPVEAGRSHHGAGLTQWFQIVCLRRASGTVCDVYGVVEPPDCSLSSCSVFCSSHVELFLWRQPLQQVPASFRLSCKTWGWCVLEWEFFIFFLINEAMLLHGIGFKIKTCRIFVTSCHRTLGLIVAFGLQAFASLNVCVCSPRGFDRNVTLNVFSLQPLEYSSYRGSRTSSRAGSARTSPVVSPHPLPLFPPKCSIIQLCGCLFMAFCNSLLNLLEFPKESVWLTRMWCLHTWTISSKHLLSHFADEGF